jgi:serine/threonine protein kinase/tetratricopeptide (TPR) repeat protein
MTDELRVRALLDDSFDSTLTPEEVCGDCPELLPAIRKRWRRMQILDAQLESLFPKPAGQNDNTPATASSEPEMPRIADHEIQGVLGRGGMGIVYQARHLTLNRVVAVKMLLAGPAAHVVERERFLREAEAVARLRHPNIVQVHGAGDHAGRPYFTMEYMDGGSLAQHLEGKPQSAREAATLAATLADAVQAAHQNGIVHRDLKPANILLTAEGVPKIADFGLARHLDGGPALTMTGSRMGTPSYMAPEQALGKASEIGPAADIYALGAIIYEMLTGRPPFRGETAIETERQVIADDPVPPTRLNPNVPRDLETICLKCLNKSPQRRYANAGELAEDLRHFLHGEPILARPTGIPERIAKWVRRHPAHSTLLAASLLLLSALVGGGSWLAIQQAHRRDAVEADLKELRDSQKIARWEEAHSALERAEARLEGGGPLDLRERLAQAKRDLDFVMQLDNIRLKRVTGGLLAAYRARAHREYASAFEKAGIGAFRDEPSSVAATINSSAVKGALLETLYDWVACASETAQRSWLLEVARHADSRLELWQESPQVLDAATWENRAALTKLTQAGPAATQSVSLMLSLGEIAIATGGEATLFLQHVQKAHPADFWANLTVGNAMCQWAPVDAVGYYRAALASRPMAAVSYCVVGDALRILKNFDEATQYYRKAIELEPSNARMQNNLGLLLQAQGKLDEAIEVHTNALALDPEYARAHFDLGNALWGKGREAEACDHYKESLRLDPSNREVYGPLRSRLLRQGRGEEALAGWQKLLDTDPLDYADWSGYAELCLFLDQPVKYRAACQELVDRFGKFPYPALAEQIGRVCLLLPDCADEIKNGVTLIDAATAPGQTLPDWIHPFFAFAKGLAEYRQGHFATAATKMKVEASSVLGSAPRLVLAMAQYQLGDHAESRRTLATAIGSFDWSAPQADVRDVWINHILRREAEALIMPNLPGLVQGTAKPANNEERFALAGSCQFAGRWYDAARWYSDALANDPAWIKAREADCLDRAHSGKPFLRVDELAYSCRYPWARCAVMSAGDVGKNGADLNETERARMRGLAREWLLSDLEVWKKVLELNPTTGREIVNQQLIRWQSDPDLAGVREASKLEKLPPDERRDFAKLWDAVAQVVDRTK